MKITAVVTVVVAFATAGAATQRRVRSGIINEDVETFRGSVELIGKDNTPVGALVFEQRGPDGAVSISGSLYGLPHGDYLSIAHDSSNYDGTCYSAGPPVLIEDLEYGGEDELFVFVPTETKGENNTLVKTSHSISLSPGDTYIGGQLILIHSVPSFESWETEESPTAYFSPDGACGFLHAAAWILALSLVSGCRATSVEAPGVIARSGAEAVLDEATEDYWAGSGSGPEDEESLRNETREALTHEASDQDAVVYVGEGATYVPVPSLKSRPLSPNLQALQTLQGLQGLAGGGTGGGGGGVGGGGTGSAGGTDEEWGRHPETWDREHRRYRPNTTRVQHIEAECQDDYMKIRIGFNGSFAGLLYSAGYSYDPDCMYVNGTGRDYYEFYIQLNRCGTLGENTHHQDSRKNPTKNLMWNTVTVQYNPMIEEEFDEHFKVTCEYGYDFWKTVTFPFLDVEVATGNPVVFTLQPPECYMEIRYGYGTTGTRVAGPVRVGDPLTLIIYMRSKYDGFDIVVNDCYAHNGGNKRIQLIDQYGCPVDDKLISRFRGSWSESGLFETQVFAYMKTFRFTGSPALYIECDVRMCHGRCPSQPCHWRNSKNVAKRSVTSAIGGPTTPATSLSENVNLFQSLRVLQEGEAEAELFPNSTAAPQNGAAESPSGDRVCLKSSLVSTIVGLGCGIVCIMAGALLAVCSRMRRAAREKLLSDSIDYMTHKGRIN